MLMALSKTTSAPLRDPPSRPIWLFRRRFHIKVKSGLLTALMPLIVSLRSRSCG